MRKKYKKWMERLRISLSKEYSWRRKLKRMELMGTKMKYSLYRTKIWLSKVTKLLLLHPYWIGIYGYGYIHGYPRKICGYVYGYGWEISYPRQPCLYVIIAVMKTVISCFMSPPGAKSGRVKKNLRTCTPHFKNCCAALAPKSIVCMLRKL